MHVKNRGMKNRGILLEGVFGFVLEKHRKPIQWGFIGCFFLCFSYESWRIGNFPMVFLPPFLPVNPRPLRCWFHRITDSYIFSLEILWTKGALNLASSFNFEVAIPMHCAYAIHICNLLFTAWISQYVIHISTCALCLCNPYQYETRVTCYELISWVFN